MDSPEPGGDSIDTIYDSLSPLVERWVRRLAGPRFDTEDLLHDVFLVVIRRYHEFRGEAQITTWLFRITSQVVRWRRRNERVRRLLWIKHGQALQEARPPGPTPIEEAERREETVRLYEALDRLPERYRTVLVLAAIEEMPCEEIATLLGIDLQTVWVRLHRARAKLADLLTQRKGRYERI
jgi:RNA polymerase sigma-70 factor (ECF subfamily)